MTLEEVLVSASGIMLLVVGIYSTVKRGIDNGSTTGRGSTQTQSQGTTQMKYH